jgi:DNA polymerase
MWGERLVLEYDAVNSLTKQWGPEKTWGGKLVENAVQGLCRCMMTAAMLALEEAGYPVVMSVHDEIICEVADEDLMNGKSIEEMVEIMCRVPAWAKDFPLKAEGKQGKRYGK